MLSQHIALDVYRVHASLIADESMSSYGVDLTRKVLSQHVKEMLRVNNILSTGNLPNQQTAHLSPTIQDIYFGEMQLASRVQEYANTALSLLSQDNPTGIDELKQQIDQQAEPLLEDLNKAVNQYQLEGEEKLQYIKRLETIVWILTIFTLLLEVIFIFQPMVRYITSLNVSNDQALENLETTVELRTLHLENANNKLKHLASHDPLTGLRNRLELEKYIEKAIEHYTQNGAPYAIMMFDIDWFKSVNDTYGHEVGDQVLVEFSSIIESSIREEDKAFRAGGEEFVVLLNRITFDDSVQLTQKIRKLIEESVFKVQNKEFSKTISCGLYHSSIFDVNSVKDVLQLIDKALYESKNNGRNRLTIVNARMNNQVLDTLAPKVIINFSDRTLKNIIEVRNEGVCISMDIEQLPSSGKIFSSLVHRDDIHLLDNLPLQMSDENPFSTTLRVIDVDAKIHICRVTVYEKENKNIVMELENAKQLAQNISDATLIRALQAMLENTNDYIYFKDANHVFVTASKTLVSVTSVEKREDFVGKIDYDVFPHELADEYFKLEREVFDHGAHVAQELQPTLDKDGNKAWVDNRKYPIYNESGSIIGLFGIARVISNYEYENSTFK